MKSLSLSTPHLIVVVGVPGSGKSFFAQQFADMFHAPLLSEDVIATNIDQPDTAAAKEAATSVLKKLLPELLKTQKTVLLDGASAMRTERAEITKIAKTAGYQPLFVWIQIDAPTAKMRCTRQARTSGKKPIQNEDFVNQMKKFSPPHPSEPYIVLSGKHTYASQAKILLRKLSAPRTNPTPTPTHKPAPTAAPESTKRSIGSRISIN